MDALKNVWFRLFSYREKQDLFGSTGPKTIKLLSACNFKSIVVIKNLIAQLASFFSSMKTLEMKSPSLIVTIKLLTKKYISWLFIIRPIGHILEWLLVLYDRINSPSSSIPNIPSKISKNLI